MFADARGTPPRLASVLFIDDRILYTDLEPSASLMQMFTRRRDSQIMGLELLAIALGMSTFAGLLSGRRVCIWSDNVGSERGVTKGAAASWDNSQFIHCIWTHAARINSYLHVMRVPSEENIADLPSRCEYDLLHALDASWLAPVLDVVYTKRESWAALSLKTVFG